MVCRVRQGGQHRGGEAVLHQAQVDLEVRRGVADLRLQTLGAALSRRPFAGGGALGLHGEGRPARSLNDTGAHEVGTASSSGSTSRTSRSVPRVGARGKFGYSSPRTRSKSPAAKAGRDSSGSSSVTSTVSAGWASFSLRMAGGSSVRTALWKAATRTVPTASPREAARAASARSSSADHDLGVGHENLPRGVEPNAPAHGFEQHSSGLLLEDAQLLRHGRRTVCEGLRHRGDGPAPGQLDQQPQPPDIPRRAADVTSRRVAPRRD